MNADANIIAALASNPPALTAYLAACDGQSAPDQEMPKATRKGANPRSSARANGKATPKAAPKARKAREPKATPTEWIVNPAWAGEQASPRMLAAALYWGVPTATCNKLKSDKLALSLAIAKARGIPVAK